MRSLGAILARLCRRSASREPASLGLGHRDERVTFAEILATAGCLDIGDIPVDLLSRCSKHEPTSMGQWHHQQRSTKHMSTVTTIAKSRVAEHAVADIFIDRWSPRAFTGESISDATLYTFFEAARWAPSSYNSQPWRFLYAKRGSAWFNVFLGLLSERNQTWARNAAVLLLIISKTSFTPPGKTDASPARNHSFDAGAAWSNFAHQATLSGWYAHGIGGFDVERARVELAVPADYHIDAAIAVGRRGDKSILPEQFHAGETPSDRKPIADIVHEGGFSS